MIETIIEWSIRNRLVVILTSLAFAAIGLRAYITMPVDAIPDLSENQVIVFTDWMGRSPQEIEDQVTYPLSVNLQGLAGVKVVRSSSEFNFSMINVIFDDSVDYYFARQRVTERLSLASTYLPPSVIPYMAPDATALGQIFWYTLEGDGIDIGELRAVQDWFVRYQLNSVPGVAEVAGVGGAPREYQIDIDPNKLRGFKISLGEVYSAVGKSNASVGGRVVHQGNAEYLIRSIGWVRGLRDVETIVVTERGGVPITVGQLGSVQIGPGFRRSVLEKDGRETVGGVVLMRFGENPLEVTRRIKSKIESLQSGLPEGVRIVPFYDRTPLIQNALATVTDTVTEELIICSVMILLVMGHLGGAMIVAVTLPLAVLFSFFMMRLFGIPSNIMSLAGIAISVGILEDQAVVMTENAAHHLTRKYGKNRVVGNNLDIIIPACQTVGRPIFFSVLITILSFLPVFALSGMEGKMFHPLAWTKTFALIGVAILAITLVPALIPLFLRGRIKSEEDSWLIRTMTAIFKPMLGWLMDRPTLVCWMFAVILGCGYLASTRLGREFMPSLDEGTILDMPTSVPRMSVTQATDDLKARDSILRAFPEVASVVGKAGRAETATDPSPLDMIETMVNLHDRSLWPKRHIRYEEIRLLTSEAHKSLISAGILKNDDDQNFINDASMKLAEQVESALRDHARLHLARYRPELGILLADEAIKFILKGYGISTSKASHNMTVWDPFQSEMIKKYANRLAVDPQVTDLMQLAEQVHSKILELKWISNSSTEFIEDQSLLLSLKSGAGSLLGIPKKDWVHRLHENLVENRHKLLLAETRILNFSLFDLAVNYAPASSVESISTLANERGLLKSKLPEMQVTALSNPFQKEFASRLLLWPLSKDELVKELDSVLQTPGWGNIWTQPIINRINMLATGVRTDVGVKVFGSDLNQIQNTSQQVAAILRGIPGAVDVVPDQVVGKGYIEIEVNRDKAARFGMSVGDIQNAIEVALGGVSVSMTVEGRKRFPIRIRYGRDFRDDIDSIRNLLISSNSETMPGNTNNSMVDRNNNATAGKLQVTLGQVADIKVTEGPSMIKSENGLLRSYVQLNVRDRDMVGFVEEAQRAVANAVRLPQGMYLEWSGEFEHQVRARKTLQIVFPAVTGIIIVLLYLTYKDWSDVGLIMLSVLGALAGGAIFQWLFEFRFSVAVWVGYIACFGMAVETGIVMLVYLREAIAERGGLEQIGSVAELREAVLEGAIHRLRPKLLTEGTTIIAIAPMLWADGVGAEVIRPMAAPVLGGLLVADEVIDVFLPVLYFAVQKRKWRKLRGLPFYADIDHLKDSRLTTSDEVGL